MKQVSVPMSLLGKASDSPEVQAMLSQGGAKDPKLRKGDVNSWVDLNDLGLALVFTDEAHLTGQENLDIGEGALILTSIRFHSGINPDFSAFAGALPLGVKFSQSQADLAATLGKPEYSNALLSKDRWLVDGTWFFANYVDELDRLMTFSMQVPDRQ